MAKKGREIMVDVVSLVVVGLCTGFGTALGNYLSNRIIIKHIDKLGVEKNVDKDEPIRFT